MSRNQQLGLLVSLLQGILSNVADAPVDGLCTFIKAKFVLAFGVFARLVKSFTGVKGGNNFMTIALRENITEDVANTS
jgi:hypothetical protein